MRMSGRTGADRRTFLRGLLGLAGVAAGGALAGCDVLRGGEPPESHEFDALLAGTVALAARYEATLAAHADLAPTITPVRDAHRAHGAALAQAMGQPAPGPGVGAEQPPADRAGALAALATAEKAARDQAVAACMSAGPRGAALIGTIAAARASHLEVLK